MAKDTNKKSHQILNETDQKEKMKMKKNKSGSSKESPDAKLLDTKSSSSSSSLKRKRGVAGDSNNGGNKATSTSGGSTSSNVNKNGLDEIDSLFTAKKQHDRQEKHKQQKQEADAKKAKREKRSMMTSTATTTGMRIHGSTKKSSASHPGDNLGTNDWVDDGLGGRFNGEGYTGRVEDGMKIFKHHVLNRPGAGSTKNCPFDCDCCFI